MILTYFVFVQSAIGIISSLFYIIFIWKYLKLNPIIKVLLQCSFLHHFLGYWLTFLTHFLTEGEFLYCFVSGYLIIVIWPVHFVCFTLISLTKLYIAKRSQEARIPNSCKILSLAILILLMHYFVKSFLVFYFYDSSAVIQNCLKNYENPSIQHILSITYNFLIMLLGILADLAMFKFFSKIKPTNGTKRIPLEATLSSSGLFFVVLIITVSLAPNLIENGQSLVHLGGVSCTSLAMIQEPLVIFFIIKPKKQVEPNQDTLNGIEMIPIEA